jgi:hypothetical protein
MLMSMAAPDPYPGRRFLDSLKVLSQRFPDGDIDYHPPNGNVFVSLPLENGAEFRVALTWQQAKFLAYSHLTGDDLQAERFPLNWPPSG